MGIAFCLLPSMSCNSSAISIDARYLTAAGGLLILVARALDKVKPGDIVEILSDDVSSQHDLSAWSRLQAHRWLGTTMQNGRWCHRIEKGTALRILTSSELDWGNRAPIQEGRFDTRCWLLGHVANIQERARTTDRIAPRGAIVEDGSPEFPFDVVDRNRAWSPGAAEFYEQATA